VEVDFPTIGPILHKISRGMMFSDSNIGNNELKSWDVMMNSVCANYCLAACKLFPGFLAPHNFGCGAWECGHVTMNALITVAMFLISDGWYPFFAFAKNHTEERISFLGLGAKVLNNILGILWITTDIGQAGESGDGAGVVFVVVLALLAEVFLIASETLLLIRNYAHMRSNKVSPDGDQDGDQKDHGGPGIAEAPGEVEDAVEDIENCARLANGVDA